MKRLYQLPKKERRAYEKESGIYKLGNLDCGATNVKYMIENNSVEEISDFLKHKATVVFYPGTPAEWFVTVFEFNRLHEYCAANGAL